MPAMPPILTEPQSRPRTWVLVSLLSLMVGLSGCIAGSPRTEADLAAPAASVQEPKLVPAHAPVTQEGEFVIHHQSVCPNERECYGAFSMDKAEFILETPARNVTLGFEWEPTLEASPDLQLYFLKTTSDKAFAWGKGGSPTEFRLDALEPGTYWASGWAVDAVNVRYEEWVSVTLTYTPLIPVGA